MATVDKNFKVKNGLIVEGTTATVDGSDIITADSITGGTQTNISVTYDAQTKQVSFVAENGIADSTTDNLTEGVSNLYYTDTRVKSVIDAAITNGTQTNITVTYDDATNSLSFTAENGVADATTDDLTEGVTNLYFTDQRAVDAVINGAVDTDDIEEGIANLYFTNQRALDATASAYDAAGSANTAENNAKSYADGLAVNYDAAGSASTAESNAKSYADGLAVNYDPAGSAANAESAAKSYADSLAVNYDPAGSAATALDDANAYTDGEITTALSTAQGYANQALADANAYTDNAVSGLTWKPAVHVLYNDATPTLSGVFATTPLEIDGHTFGPDEDGYRVLVTSGNDGSTDAGIYVYTHGTTWTLTRASDADTNDELIGASVYVMEGTQYGSTSWVQGNHYITGFADQSWTQFSGQGSVTAGTGITVDGLEVSINRTTVDAWYDAAGSANTAEANANDYTDGKITTEVSERNTAIANAIDAITTTDIEEGTNKYFTDSRAVDAIQAVVPVFTAVDVNSVAKNIAATVNVPTAGTVSAYLFSATAYRSAEYLVKIKNGSHTEISKVLVTLDTSDNVAITEYGIVGTNGSLGTITADIGSGNVRLRVTTLNDNSDIMVYGTLLV